MSSSVLEKTNRVLEGLFEDNGVHPGAGAPRSAWLRAIPTSCPRGPGNTLVVEALVDIPLDLNAVILGERGKPYYGAGSLGYQADNFSTGNSTAHVAGPINAGQVISLESFIGENNTAETQPIYTVLLFASQAGKPATLPAGQLFKVGVMNGSTVYPCV